MLGNGERSKERVLGGLANASAGYTRSLSMHKDEDAVNTKLRATTSLRFHLWIALQADQY